ncbi:MAG: phage head closure protein [Eubacterium sp.]|nr:phage head closure protein [Eubacterium sp.]
MKKSKFDRYNDGVVSLYRMTETKTDFNARKNPKSVDDMELIYRNLHFGRLSKRNQDMELAEQSGFKLTMKIKVPRISGVTAKDMAVIGTMLYSIKYMDEDDNNSYLYLEGVREIDAE